jgi:hypothetical protein
MQRGWGAISRAAQTRAARRIAEHLPTAAPGPPVSGQILPELLLNTVTEP